MNILIINHYAGSLNHGMEFRPYYLASEWVKKGHTVDIIAASYSHLRQKNPRISSKLEKQNINGITYHWIRTSNYKGNGIKRAANIFQFVGKLLLKSSFFSRCIKPDVVIASSTYPLDTYPAARIAKKCSAKLIHEIHDLWPLTLHEIGGMSKIHPFYLLLHHAEKRAYRYSDAVVSILPETWKYMTKYGLEKKKFVHIPNGIFLPDWYKPCDLPDMHLNILTELKKRKSFIVGYFGGHALSNALDQFINSAEYIRDENISFVLVGDGTEKDRLINEAKQKNLENICFLPPVKKQSIPTLLKYFDAVYIGLADNKLYDYGISMNKTYDAMMSGRPIIYAVNAANNEITENKCGISVKPDDPREIVSAVQKLKKLSEDELKTLGEKGHKAVFEKYNYRSIADKFLGIMSS